MGLSQSLYTGYSGLGTHQKSMDNISHNLANVNTYGYKKNDFMFGSLFNKAITGSMPENGDRTNTNPVGVGMGVSTGAIVGNFSTGPIETTNNPFDCALTGNGFFIVNTGTGTALTRDGAFYLEDGQGLPTRRLLTTGGMAIQGWNAQDNVIDPTGNIGDIIIPSLGSAAAGRRTGSIDLDGILPTNTSTSDFSGTETRTLELAGNLGGENPGLTTSIFAPVTQANGNSSSGSAVEEVNVRIDFSGPTLSGNGETYDWTWTMTTVDWPNPGDPGVQVYPTSSDSNFSQATMSFHSQGSTDGEFGAGQAVSNSVAPGSADVQTSYTDENGNVITASFSVPSDFTIDIEHMTNMDNPVVGGGPSVWHRDGNPEGTMARSVLVFEEYTSFASQDGVMVPVRGTESRNNTVFFERTEESSTGTTWTWRGSDGGTGELSFDTNGALTSSTQSGGSMEYRFNDIQNINMQGRLQATAQDGYRDGILMEFNVDTAGKVWGRYSNGLNQQLAQVAVGNVANPTGLVKASGTMYYVDENISGPLMIGIAGDPTDSGRDPIGVGVIQSRALEGSNVVLAKEFTNMISIERGYQFSSRIVSTSNELLQTALNLKQ